MVCVAEKERKSKRDHCAFACMCLCVVRASPSKQRHFSGRSRDAAFGAAIRDPPIYCYLLHLIAAIPADGKILSMLLSSTLYNIDELLDY